MLSEQWKAKFEYDVPKSGPGLDSIRSTDHSVHPTTVDSACVNLLLCTLSLCWRLF